MAPKDFIAARHNKAEEATIIDIIDGQPYYPKLVADANDHASIRHVVATLFGVNGESKSWPVSIVSGGITNQLFRVDMATINNSNDQSNNNNNNNSILVRIFGAEGMIDRDVETATFAALATQGLAPKYYGRFANGRLEEWLDGMQPLTPRGMAEPAISQSIAQQLARLHAHFTVPEDLKEVHNDQEPSMWTQLDDWMEQASKANFQNDHDTQQRALLLLQLPQIPAELTWLRHSVVPQDASVAFCHNDLLAANILHNPTTTNNGPNAIQLIDFEYGGINYKAFDIANHFNEYAGGTDDGNTHYEWFPTKEHQLAFLKTYLESATNNEPLESTIQEWYDQVQPFLLANHLYWGLWAVNQAVTEGCQDFDYLLYARNRITRYFECKEKDFSEENLN